MVLVVVVVGLGAPVVVVVAGTVVVVVRGTVVLVVVAPVVVVVGLGALVVVVDELDGGGGAPGEPGAVTPTLGGPGFTGAGPVGVVGCGDGAVVVGAGAGCAGL